MRFLAFIMASFALTGCLIDWDPDPEPEPAPQPAKAATPAPSSSSSSSSTQASTVAPGTCAPNALCGGLTSCNNSCYGEDCCRLQCGCGSGNDQDHLYCQMQCDK